MTLLSPDNGRIKLLQFALANASPSTYTLHLYKNNYTPSAGSILASFTESTDASYASITLTGATWTVTANAGVVSGVYPSQTFTFSGAETLYGYYIQANSTALWAELFTSPFVMPGGGGNIVINPDISLSN